MLYLVWSQIFNLQWIAQSFTSFLGLEIDWDISRRHSVYTRVDLPNGKFTKMMLTGKFPHPRFWYLPL